MASTYSTNLALELIGTGDQAGTWGNTTNTNLGTLIEQAISGYVTQAVSTGTDTTITIPNGSTGVARNMYIELTGTGGTNTNLIVPANKKLYFIFNNSTGAVTVKVSGQTGVSVPAGKKMVLVSNGTDIVNAANYVADFGSNSATITQLTSTSATITNLTLTSLVLSNLSIASANVTTLTSASATITNLLATSLTVSGNTFLATSSGNVGIGTSSPAEKLNLYAASASVGGLIDSGGTSSVSFLQLKNSAASGRTYSINVGGPTSSFGSNFFIYDNTAAATRVTLDSSGNLGLGVTPSAWDSSQKVLQVSGSSFYGFTGGTVVTQNAYYNSGFKYINTAPASYYQQFGAEHQWYTAPSGTINTAISFTQAMTLDASGALTVGGNIIASQPGTGNVGLSIARTGGTAVDWYLYAPSGSQDLVFFRSSERARITAAGDFLVGVTSALFSASNRGVINVGGSSGGLLALRSGSDTGYLFQNSANLSIQNDTATGYISFGTNLSTERARITSGGDFDVGTTANDGWKIHASATADQIRWSYDRNSYSAIFGFATHRGDSGGVEIGNINSSSDRSICFSNGTSYAGRTERARITSGGNLLVGKTADDTTTVGAQITAGGIINSAGTTDFFNAYSTSAAAYRFYVTNGGTIFATNTTISAISDQRLKENVRDLDVGLDAVMALKPRKFDWKEGKGQDKKDVRGFIAQEFEQVFPDLIDTWKDPAPEGEEPYKSVRQDLIPVLVKAIQELKAELDAAKVKIAALEAK